MAQPTLRITSLPDGTIVHPSQSLAVTVEAPPPRAFQMVIIGGRHPIGFSQLLTAPPYRFTIQIPGDIDPDQYTLIADDATAPGKGTSSQPITIIVERADSPVRLWVEPSILDLSLTQKGYLRVVGEFADGTTADLTIQPHHPCIKHAPAVAIVRSVGRHTCHPGSMKVISPTERRWPTYP